MLRVSQQLHAAAAVGEARRFFSPRMLVLIDRIVTASVQGDASRRRHITQLGDLILIPKGFTNTRGK